MHNAIENIFDNNNTNKKIEKEHLRVNKVYNIIKFIVEK